MSLIFEEVDGLGPCVFLEIYCISSVLLAVYDQIEFNLLLGLQMSFLETHHLLDQSLNYQLIHRYLILL